MIDNKRFLEAIYFIGLVKDQPHRMGEMIIDNVGTKREATIVENLKSYRDVLVVPEHVEKIDAIISAFEVR